MLRACALFAEDADGLRNLPDVLPQISIYPM